MIYGIYLIYWQAAQIFHIFLHIFFCLSLPSSPLFVSSSNVQLKKALTEVHSAHSTVTSKTSVHRHTMGKTKTNTLVPLTTETKSNPCKRSKEDLDSSDDHVETLDDLLFRMQQMFNETNSRIEQSKCDLRSEIADLREDVQQFKQDCSNEVLRLTESVNDIRSNALMNEERLLASMRTNDLLLSGVPYKPNEDLVGYSSKVSSALGYNEQNLPLIHTKRLARLPIEAGASPPIVLQFAFKNVRDDFYQRYLSSRSLSLNHLGFSINKRIYVNENLTVLARQLKAHAIKLKKTGKLHNVFTKDGFVFIKRKPEDQAQMVLSMDGLE